MDAGPIDTLINDFPEECLDKDVSPRLGIKYLSACEKKFRRYIETDSVLRRYNGKNASIIFINSN